MIDMTKIREKVLVSTPIILTSSVQSLLASHLSQDICSIVKEDMDEDAIMSILVIAFSKANERSEKHVRILEQELDRLQKSLPS